ncbi:MAG: glutamyl-tRNA reductase [Verrucomicrobiaceae bacterium]|nr:glutamyl-tRNA reductase [Verrucomicrobiaceae bacterium]
MELFSLGLNHESASVAVREKLAVSESEAGEICSSVVALEGVDEAVVLSTCNRLEIYVSVEESCLTVVEDYIDEMLILRGTGKLPLYKFRGASVARHLCRVASGLDSMVLGETEILGQLKKSYALAHSSGNTGKRLNRLFQNTFKVAKFVRTNSQITRGATSVGAAGVDLAEKIFGDLSRCMVMVFGAGEMGKVVTKTLASRGVKGVIVSNRSYEKAVELAGDMEGRAMSLEEGVEQLKLADIVITSTSAPHRILGINEVASAVRKRRGRPLFMIDIAVPRDIEQDVGDLAGVYLYDIDALQGIAASARSRREKQVIHCEALIDEQMRYFDLHNCPGEDSDIG